MPASDLSRRRRGGKPSRLHAGLVEVIREQYPAIETKAFGRALRAALGELWDDDPFLDGIARRRPDAYLIDVATEEVTLFEIEITSYLSEDRLRGWMHLWFVLDSMSWDLTLYRVDRVGQVNRTDLTAHYYAWLMETPPAIEAA